MWIYSYKTINILFFSVFLACSNQKFSLIEVQETFGQTFKYNTEVDILWLIDTSASMASHQNRLSDEVPAFFEALDRLDVDYQMAVTTMDMSGSGERGRFVSEDNQETIIHSGHENRVYWLQNRIRAGEMGSPLERGLEAMRTALADDNLINSSNRGFLREDALLLIIALSDEDDQSAPYDYIGFLDDLKPPTPFGDRSWVFHFMGIVPDDPSCETSQWGFSDVGYAYLEMAALSGGVQASICHADLVLATREIHSRLMAFITEYELDRIPVVSSIVVMVNDEVVPEDKKRENGWVFDEERNSIRFYGEAIPPDGARVHIDFDPLTL